MMRDAAREQGSVDAASSVNGTQLMRVGEDVHSVSTSPATTSPVPSLALPRRERHDFRPHSRSGAPSSPSLSGPKSWLFRRPKTAPGPGHRPAAFATPTPLVARSHLADDIRRDSALQTATPGIPGTPATTAPSTVNESIISRVSSVPAIVVSDSPSGDRVNGQRGGRSGTVTESAPRIAYAPSSSFSGISMSIPASTFDDLTCPDKVQFSNRGSMLLDGKRAAMFNNGTSTPHTPSIRSDSIRPENNSTISLASKQRVMSSDEAELSQRVRSMYDFGNERGVDWSERTVIEEPVMEEEEDDEKDEEGEGECETPTPTAQLSATDKWKRAMQVHSPSSIKRESVIPREPYEAAGGIEDWQDVGIGAVDRYGFIIPKVESRGSNHSGTQHNSPGLMRVSTALVDLSESPRKKRTIRRSASRSAKIQGIPSKRLSKGSLRPPESIYSTRSTSSLSVHQSPLRYATNRLPHNRERRWMDEASDMLTLPPGLEELAAVKEGGKAALAMKRKEWKREEKWRRMGRTSQTSIKGGGMLFDFDPRDAKVISRTWKGIPDRWRSSAWYSFLTASAKKRKDSPSDAELIEAFHAFQEESSPDDVQIDCDVPRTINRHIMFRRRYRGGQRLLFRVLHALSLHFPDNGYVQGMAALAATLLCYFDEEHAFVMMVRLWQLRGLDRLYSAGFGGLMEALDDFEKNWLRGNDVAKKLDELGITSTAYGTRWYLTMFNYSIPFPAQLRVWDAFMLLGDLSNSRNPENAFGADLDILHATSAALVDATREILLDSDFENAMKVLTSWIPVKDEDLLMKVAFAEWKQRKKRP